MFSRKTESPTDTTTRQKSPYFFVQPTIGKCVEDAVDDADDNDYFYNQRYSVYSLFRSQYTSNAETFCAAKADPIFLTNSGFANCGCGNAELAKSADTENRLRRMKTRNRIEMLLKRGGQDLEKFYSTHYALEDERDRVNDAANKKLSTRSASCGSDAEEFPKMDGRRVSMLVDELLLKIYGGRERTFSSGGTDVYPNDYSTDSSSNLVFKNNVILKKKCSFTAIPEDKRRKWFDVMRARLMGKSLSEMRTLKEALEYNVSYVGSMLIRQLKRKDFLIARRDAQCGVITAFLQAKSAKRSEDTKIQFSMKPSAGESGFQQWHGAMKMVARLSGGIPHEFRKTLWLTLAERHISSKNIKWSLVERTCFNDSTNPDDEELGVQIVKDLHRTGCSLFCGTSAEENQAVLKRVLLAYARWNKSVGYCQGFNMLAALILEVMDRCEYDSLKVMIYLIEGVLPESYFANSLRGLSIDMAVFRDLLRLKLPELSKHLEQLQLVSNDAAGNTYEPPLTNVFTMQWFLTLFSNCLPHSTVLRVWDLIFLEGNPILLKTALAIWDTLSDRIMPVKSADEFYSIMGVLTREMLEFGLMDANSLIKTITCIELYELTELRERYIYNITPWTQVARKGLRLFYSDDETEDSDDEPSDGKSSDRGYGFLKVATKHGSQSIRSISPSSLLAPLANEKDKIALDISALKKQYCKIKERQRQTQIIFTAACNTQDIMGSMVSTTPGSAINHLLLSKNLSSMAKLARNTKSSTAPVSRAVQRLKETSTSALQGDDALKDRGETVYWDKRKKKKRKRRRTEINFQKNGCDPPKSNTIDKCVDSDSSSTSTASSSFKSSTSTELCDDVGEFDSEDATTSEYCSSPHHKLRSSNASLPEDDKDAVVATDKRSQANTAKPDLPFDTSGYASSDCVNDLPNLYDSDQQQILNVLLTTSIIANEQLNNDALGESPHESADAPNDAGNADELRPRSDLHLSHFLNNVEKISRRVSYSTTVEHNPLFKTNSADNINYDQTGRKSFDFDDGIAERKSTTAPADIEKELENMKIDALEILFSSSTLESIRNEKRNDDECQTVREDLREDAKSSAEDVKFTFQINKDTEMALQRILHENTEVLKKVNQNYSTRQCRDPKTALISADEQRKSETNDLHETEANTADTASVNFNPLWYADDELAALEENKMEGDDDEFSVHSNGTEETEMNSLEYTNFLSDFRKNSGGLLEYQPNDSLFDAFAKDVDLRNNLDSNDYLYVQTKCEDDVNGSNDGQFRVKCKSLDNLNGKSKLKIGLVSRTGKWISISIDNSDLIINNATLVSNRDDEMAARQGVDHISDNAVGEKDTEIKTAHELHGFENTSFDGDSNSNNLCDPFLHLNFSIIPTGKKKKDPIEQYMQKKNMLMQSQKGAAELKTLNFNPFPARPTNRPPKEIGVKLGLYSSAKK